jgi:hypothetical protein
MPPSYDNTGLSHESPFQAVLVPGPVGATQPPPAQSGSTVVASIEEIRAQHEAASARVAQQNALSSFVPSFQVQADMDTSSGAYEPSPIAPPLPEVPNLATSDAQQTRFDGPKPVAKIPLKSTPAADAKPPKGPDEINKTIERPPLHERKTQEAPSPSSSSTGPLATGRHAMVQEALAKLRRRADVDAGASSSRKKAAKRAATNGGASAPPPTQNRSRRRRRRLSAAESQNPELLDLYQKALADLDAETKF